MKKLLLISALFFAFMHVQLAAQIEIREVVYVKQGGNGDGTSWQSAFGDLQQALLNAKPGQQQIWVAAGTYYPTKSSNRNISFNIPDNIELYGGFSGAETSVDQRDWEVNLTILSGNIGSPASNDNSYTVVYTKNVSMDTVIDGFVITGGSSDGVNDLGDAQRCGAGWFNHATKGESSPNIENCLFVNNYARDGAGLYNFAEAGNCNPSILNCQFVNNKADLDGGGMLNHSRKGSCFIDVDACLFFGNRADNGSGISNLAEAQEVKVNVTHSLFEGNTSRGRDLIYDNVRSGGVSKSYKKACRFADNVSVLGMNENNAKGQLSDAKKDLIIFYKF